MAVIAFLIFPVMSVFHPPSGIKISSLANPKGGIILEVDRLGSKVPENR